MKSDLDQLMKDDGVDAIWVTGSLQNNPDMVYFTGIHHVSQAELIKKQGKEPVLFLYSSMEREEGEKSNLQTRLLDNKWPLDRFLKKSNGDLTAALAERMGKVFEELDLTEGCVAVSGNTQVSRTIGVLDDLRKQLPGIDFRGYTQNSLIDRASMTKDTVEVERIRNMGKITTEVVSRTWDYLANCKILSEKLVNPFGEDVTVSMVKSKIRLWLAEVGADNPKETIFAIGHDAGIPHSTGNPDDILAPGKPIVFDIFPCEAGGGYFYDFTRTWCVGWAPEEVQKLHEQVKEVHHTIIDELKENAPFKRYQLRTCELFSNMGHKTICESYNLDEGYTHSVGHGLGLKVHEKPFSGISAKEDDILREGVVFSIEPGLYYPSKNVGVRVEDTVYLNPGGTFEKLADFPYDLIVPVKT